MFLSACWPARTPALVGQPRLPRTADRAAPDSGRVSSGPPVPAVPESDTGGVEIRSGTCWTSNLPGPCLNGTLSATPSSVCATCLGELWCARIDPNDPADAAVRADGATCSRRGPVFRRVHLPGRVVGVYLSDELGCALVAGQTESATWCWGEGISELRRRSEEPQRTPALNGSEQFVSSAVAFCARQAGGELRCWRNVPWGETPGSHRAVVPEAIDLAVGTAAVCALTRGGEVRCWGQEDRSARFVEGTVTPRSVAAPTMRQIAIGDGTLCGRSADDQVLCADVLVNATPAAGEPVVGFSSFRPRPCLSPSRALFGDLGCVLSWRRDGRVVGVGENCFGAGLTEPPADPDRPCDRALDFGVEPEAEDVAAGQGFVCWLRGRRVRCRMQDAT